VHLARVRAPRQFQQLVHAVRRFGSQSGRGGEASDDQPMAMAAAAVAANAAAAAAGAFAASMRLLSSA
jgi:hypothetical protein